MMATGKQVSSPPHRHDDFKENISAASKRFEEFVWAKVVGYPYWPGVIIIPGLCTPPRPKDLIDQRVQLVYFCGTYEYAWIQENHIKPYNDGKYETFKSHGKKNKRLKKAIDEMDEMILRRTENADYKVPLKSFYNRTTQRIEMLAPGPREKKIKVEIPFLMHVTPSFGVVGMGAIGKLIIDNLLKSQFIVNAWNRTYYKYEYPSRDLLHFTELSEMHLFNHCPSARYVLHRSDIVFFCISDVKGLLEILHNQCRLHESNNRSMLRKGIILITTTDSVTSNYIKKNVIKKGGRFLDVTINKVTSEGKEERRLVACGDKGLYDKCQETCFPSLGVSKYFEDLCTSLK